MSRYFFNVIDGQTELDLDGTELPDMAAVRFQAIRTAGEILASEKTGLSQGHPWLMSVVDAGGVTVFSLHFEAEEYHRPAG